MSKLTDVQIAEALESLPRWAREGESIVRTYEFADFDAALDFMQRAAAKITELDHHPTWTNTYSTVHVELSSHDVGGVTARDVRLAVILDQLADV